MHFLCLHGLGTNSQILEAQTAALRYELGDSHSYDYAEGTIPHPMDPEVATYFRTNEGCFAYFDPEKPETFSAALSHLQDFIEQEGPFDAILAYSHGAQLAAAWLAVQDKKGPAYRSIRCAVFLSGGIPYELVSCPNNGRPVMRHMDPCKTGVVVDVPTTHIWGRDDRQYPGTSEVLSNLCVSKWREVFIHPGGHEVPGASAKEAVVGAALVIRKTVGLAVTLQ
ncbi:serine hydrolase FSH [Aspergillus minisclerotigenes]|uniref:Serine hydrolase FSH n=1 Tax=Aspergillus minisclerotigenes TaxID=656917 RepID=A0A5N6IV57_9EURO|nr:serine hydrolase FSH [Aspergillus minisclerotigenes]